MSRAPHATPHAHTRAHTPSHARPFSPAASRARESQDGRREGLQRAPPSPAGAATRGGPRSQSRAVGCPSSMPPTSGPSMPVLPRPAPPGPDGSGPPGAGGGSCGPGVPRGGDTGGLPEQLVCACGAEYTRRHTHVCRCAAPGVLGGAACWVESGSQARSPPAVLRRAERAGALGAGGRGEGRERRQEQRGRSLEWARDTAQRGLVVQVLWQGVVGTGQESHVDAPPTGSAVRRGHTPGASLWPGALTGATGGPGEPSWASSPWTPRGPIQASGRHESPEL